MALHMALHISGSSSSLHHMIYLINLCLRAFGMLREFKHMFNTCLKKVLKCKENKNDGIIILMVL